MKKLLTTGIRSTSIIIMSCLLLSIFVAPLRADEITWDGDGGDGLWSNPLNWSGDTLPQETDTIQIPDNSGQVFLDMDFSLTGTITVNGSGTTLTINNGVTLTLDSSFLHPGLYNKIVVSQHGSTIINEGVVEGINSLPIIYVEPSSTFINNNTLNVSGNLGLFLRWGGTATNNGTMNTVRITTLTGTLDNSGLIDDAMLNLQFATVTNDAGGTINISPTLGDSRFLNTTIFDNHGTVTNSSTITNESTFHNFGTFDNTNGTFVNSCDFGHGTAGTFNNTGSFIGNPIVEECKVWDNDSGNGQWSDPLNWSGDSLPVSTEDIIINTGGGVDANVTVDVNVTIDGQLSLSNSVGPPMTSTLVIQSGIILTNNGSILAAAHTTINNQGSIVNNYVMRAISCLASFINAGSFSGNPFLGLCSTWDGDGGDGLWSNPLNWSDNTLPQTGNTIQILDNSGQVFLDMDFSLTGTITVNGSGTTLTINNGVTLTLDSSFLHPGLYNKIVVSQHGSTIINEGVVEGINSLPVIYVEPNSTFINNNTLNVSGNLGLFLRWGGTATNNGTMNTVRITTLTGTLDNSGLIDDAMLNLQFATVTNDGGGTINISPTLGDSRFLNTTLFNNHGTVTNSATITNESTFHNFGTFDNTNGTFQNDDAFYSECNSVLFGSISGNPPIEVSCDTTPPVLSVPANFSIEAESSAGAFVSFSVTATDDTDGSITPTCTPPSDSIFPLGTTTVSCTATDAAGNTASDTFTVTVVDTTPPEVTAPPDITLEATAHLTDVTLGSAIATDLVDGFLDVFPNNTGPFPVDETIVTWSATDAAGNTGTATQTVEITDTTPPILTVPSDMVVEANTALGATVTFSASATDIADPSPVVTCTPPSGSFFPLGPTEVSCTATDASGNTTSNTFTVTVEDTTPPILSVPLDQTVEATSPLGAVVNFTVTATDIADPSPVVVSSPVSGSTFSLGSTTVTCTATDASGNTASDTFTVTVEDTTPPDITCPNSITVFLNTPYSSPAISNFLAGASAVDLVDQDVLITHNAPTSFDSVGEIIVTFTATDDYGNQSTCNATISVIYSFGGFGTPVSLEKPFKLGRTVPVKFQLTDANGSYVSTAIANINLQLFSNSTPTGDPVEPESTSGADVGNTFRYDAIDNQYIYNLSTRGLSAGTWQIQVTLDDGTVHTVFLSLK